MQAQSDRAAAQDPRGRATDRSGSGLLGSGQSASGQSASGRDASPWREWAFPDRYSEAATHDVLAVARGDFPIRMLIWLSTVLFLWYTAAPMTALVVVLIAGIYEVIYIPVWAALARRKQPAGAAILVMLLLYGLTQTVLLGTVWRDGSELVHVVAYVITTTSIFRLTIMYGWNNIYSWALNLPRLFCMFLFPLIPAWDGSYVTHEEALWFTFGALIYTGTYVNVALRADWSRRRLSDLHSQAEEQRRRAEEASEAKSRFLAVMSHEIRTPMNGVLGMAQSLNRDDLTAEQHKKVTTILESGTALMGVLNDVLDHSKIEAGRLDINPSAQDLGELLRQVCRLWDGAAREKGLSLSLTMTPQDPGLFVFDGLRVRQCVNNLLSNAVKFTETGTVRVRAEVSQADRGEADRGKAEITIQVEDQGIGMTRETLSALFTPFSQADGGTARRFGGTGLGLSITRTLAGLMGGDVTVSSAVGEGSTFVLRFAAVPGTPYTEPAAHRDAPTNRSSGEGPAPMPRKPVLSRKKPAKRGTSTGNPVNPRPPVPAPEHASERTRRPVERIRRILLVDDMEANREVAKLFLEDLDADFTEAENGREALDRLGETSYDLVLMDMHMPVMDGAEAIGEIRNADRPLSTIPVIALTADAMAGDEDRFRAMGFDGYVSKPIDAEKLLAEIKRVCRPAVLSPA